MTREEAAEIMTMGRGMQGYDDELDDGIFGADDPIRRGGLSTLTIQLSIANAAALNVTLFSNTDVDAAALPTGIVSPALATYKQIVKYFLANPAVLQSINLSSNESTTTGAPLLQSMSIIPSRTTPFGVSATNSLPVQSLQTTQDYQPNRTTVPLRAVVDGFTALQLTSATNSSGATILVNAVFFFGRRNEGRNALKKSGQPLTMAPGGRGPRAIK